MERMTDRKGVRAGGRSRVLAIGLDSAEPSLLDEYMRRGYLPTLARLRRQGVQARLDNFDLFSAETPWTTIVTGCSPRTLGYWSPLRFSAGRYQMETRAAYEYRDVPPFYALGDEFRVAVFDVPQVRICPNVNGVQVGAWGAHSPQVPSASFPPELFDELVSRHGEHPGLHDDYAECLNLEDVERLRRILPVGIRRRADICVDLLGREQWDLFVTVFGEPHTIGHNMWQVSCADHPLYKDLAPKVEGNPMRELMEAIDLSLGRIVEAAGDDTRVLVFSGHGMGPNTMDLPSIAFLPEFMYRFCFPGRRALGANSANGGLPAPTLKCLRKSWMWEVWSRMEDESAVRRLLRRSAPWGLLKYIDRHFTDMDDLHDQIASPFALMDKGVREVPFQPASWFMPLWPHMKAFALPSFSEGYIRLNVKGREPHGMVEPEDFSKTVDEIVAALGQLKDARSGVPMVRKIERVRSSARDTDAALPDADIVVGWQESHATDTVESPLVGRIGPLPHFRAGSHRSEGFLVAAGPGIPQGVQLPRGHALDLAPTILDLMGAPIAQNLEGRPLPIREQDQPPPVPDEGRLNHAHHRIPVFTELLLEVHLLRDSIFNAPGASPPAREGRGPGLADATWRRRAVVPPVERNETSGAWEARFRGKVTRVSRKRSGAAQAAALRRAAGPRRFARAVRHEDRPARRLCL